MVEQEFSKLHTRVRFPSPAPMRASEVDEEDEEVDDSMLVSQWVKDLRRKLRRALITQPTVRPHLIVFLPPVLKQHPLFNHGANQLTVLILTPKPTAETLRIPLLPFPYCNGTTR